MRALYPLLVVGLLLQGSCGTAPGSESGEPGASVVLNQSLVIDQDGVADGLTGSCSTLVQGQSFGMENPPSFYQPAVPRASDLEVAVSFDGRILSVTARKAGSTATTTHSVSFDYLRSGGEDMLTIDREAGGAYELRTWAGPCQYAP